MTDGFTKEKKAAASVLSLLMLVAGGCSGLAQLQPVRVQGKAMEPALKDGDRVILTKDIDKLERGDIVVFHFPKDPTKSYIKRIIGLPGEEVQVDAGRIMVDGRQIEEAYVDPKNNQSHFSRARIKLAPGSFYVLGDNRDNSSDSRIWGPVERHFIYGKFVRKYY